MGSSVVLVGFMGAGKTSVGRGLAQRLGWRFDDLDDCIEAQEGRSIEDIFRDSGEAEFRRVENKALRKALGELNPSPRIIALGGGAMAQSGNAELLREAGVTVIFLEAPVEELFRRCEQEDRKRPLRRDFRQFRDLYEQRYRFYAGAAHRVSTSGKDLETVVAEVACSLGLE